MLWPCCTTHGYAQPSRSAWILCSFTLHALRNYIIFYFKTLSIFSHLSPPLPLAERAFEALTRRFTDFLSCEPWRSSKSRRPARSRRPVTFVVTFVVATALRLTPSASH